MLVLVREYVIVLINSLVTSGMKNYGVIFFAKEPQGFWLDINTGNYPYITGSTLPFSAFRNRIHNTFAIYGAAKIYDTRVGIDTDFPEELDEDPNSLK